MSAMLTAVQREPAAARVITLCDTGATTSICCEQWRYTPGSMQRCRKKILLADGKHTYVDGVGRAFGIPGVHYMAGGQCNLIAANDIFSMGNELDRTDGSALIFRDTETKAETWRFVRRGAAWELESYVDAGDGDRVLGAFGNTDPLMAVQLHHQRFGHLNFSTLRKMVKVGAVEGLALTEGDFEAAGKPQLCEGCAAGKQHRLPFCAQQPAPFCYSWRALAVGYHGSHATEGP